MGQDIVEEGEQKPSPVNQDQIENENSLGIGIWLNLTALEAHEI